MLTPAEMQQAIQEYMNRNGSSSNQWEVAPIKQDGVSAAMANKGFTPIQSQPQQVPGNPQFNVIPLPDDLKAVLVEAVTNRQMELFTPENVFIQQALREIKELRKDIDALRSQMLQNGQSAFVTQTDEQSRLLPKELVFQESANQDVSNGEEEKPKSKSVRKGRRSVKS